MIEICEHWGPAVLHINRVSTMNTQLGQAGSGIRGSPAAYLRYVGYKTRRRLRRFVVPLTQ